MKKLLIAILRTTRHFLEWFEQLVNGITWSATEWLWEKQKELEQDIYVENR